MNNGNLIFRVSGGMGNQMFQYAAALYYAQVFNCRSELDLSWFRKDRFGATPRKYELGHYDLSVSRVNLSGNLRSLGLNSEKFKFINKILKINRVYEEDVSGLRTIHGGYCYFDGFWQNKMYIERNLGKLKKEFQIKIRDNELIKEKERISGFYDSVAVHIRRGDYVTTTDGLSNFGACDCNYYRDALKVIKEKVGGEIKILFFSDDINWVKTEFKNEKNAEFIQNSEKASYWDFELMRSCKNFIISNSTYSWWAAILTASSKELVIAPKSWTLRKPEVSHLYPNNWIKL